MLLEEASLLPRAPDQSDSSLVKDVLDCVTLGQLLNLSRCLTFA